MGFAIVLYSKHTGEACHLGVQYATLAELQDYVDKQVCTRCNRVETVPVPDGARWVSRHLGFQRDRPEATPLKLAHDALPLEAKVRERVVVYRRKK